MAEMRSRCLHCAVVEALLHALYNLPGMKESDLTIKQIKIIYHPFTLDSRKELAPCGWLKEKGEKVELHEYPFLEAEIQKNRLLEDGCDWALDFWVDDRREVLDCREWRRAHFEDIKDLQNVYEEELLQVERVERIRPDLLHPMKEHAFRDFCESMRVHLGQLKENLPRLTAERNAKRAEQKQNRIRRLELEERRKAE